MKSRTTRRWPRWPLEIAAILALLLVVNAWHTRDVPRGQAPALSGTLLDGTSVSLTDFRGKPVLLHFWATWCPICDLEQDTIDALARDFAVLTVAMDAAAPEKIRGHLRDKGVNYPVIHDRDFSISRRHAIRVVPTSIILDADGRIRFVAAGYTTGIGLRLRLWWTGLH